jgi:hypothetical protein
MNRDQIEKLTPEQQETYADLEARRVRKREDIKEQARNYWGRLWLPPLLAGICFFGCIFEKNHHELVLYFMGLFLFFSIQFHAAGVNRRLDALVELYGPDWESLARSGGEALL